MPLILAESRSEQMDRILDSDLEMAVWWGTVVECNSAVRRKQRNEELDGAQVAQARAMFNVLAGRWGEILPGNSVRAHALRLVATHPLTAADAFQLAAAIEMRVDLGTDLDFVCLDERLADSASREGFNCLPE